MRRRHLPPPFPRRIVRHPTPLIMPPTLPELLDHLDRLHARTRRLLPLIPPEDLHWSPREGWYSFATLARHLADTERGLWAETIAGRPARYPGHAPKPDDTLATVIEHVDQQHAESRAIFAALTPESLTHPVTTPAGATMTAWKWLRAFAEHEAHHRGQLYLMLAMRGVATPPIFGLTAEQVHAASVP